MVPVRFLYSTYLSPKKLTRNFSSPVKVFCFWLVIYFLYLFYTCEPEVRREANGGFLSFFLFFFLSIKKKLTLNA